MVVESSRGYKKTLAANAGEQTGNNDTSASRRVAFVDDVFEADTSRAIQVLMHLGHVVYSKMYACASFLTGQCEKS